MSGQPEQVTNLFGAIALVTSDAIRAGTEAAAGRSDTAPAALVALHESARGRSVDELRRIVGLTPSGGVRLVDRLVGENYVERRSGLDGRAVIVALTSVGRKAARAVLVARASAIEQVLEPLNAVERAQLRDLCDKLVRGTVTTRLSDRRHGAIPRGGWMCRLCDFEACGRPHGACPAADETADRLGTP